jgi:hypothetical protein
MQCYTVYLSLETAPNVSGGISSHHQEHTQLYLQNLALVKPLLLPAAVVEELEPIIRSTYNCIYSIWHLSNRYCYLPLLWKRWNWFECGVGNVLICFGAAAAAPKQMQMQTCMTVPTPPRQRTVVNTVRPVPDAVITV